MALYRKKALMNGLPMMDGDTLLGHLKWLENRESLPDFSTELLDYHYETVYRNGEENPSIEAALEHKINQWRR